MMGHNSKNRVEDIQAIIAEYADTHKQSQALNDKRTELRERAKDLGLDTKALQSEVKLSMETATQKKRDGYDESAKEIREAIKGMNAAQLWSHVFERAEAKEKERAEAKEKREKQKASDDSFKAAPDRAPKAAKVISGKEAASGEKADDIGAQQGAAFNAAHGGKAA